jgi:hypothetical protein
METPEPTEATEAMPAPPAAPEPPTAQPDRDLVTLGHLEAEFTELERELEQVDRAGASRPGTQAPAS